MNAVAHNAQHEHARLQRAATPTPYVASVAPMGGSRGDHQRVRLCNLGQDRQSIGEAGRGAIAREPQQEILRTDRANGTGIGAESRSLGRRLRAGTRLFRESPDGDDLQSVRLRRLGRPDDRARVRFSTVRGRRPTPYSCTGPVGTHHRVSPCATACVFRPSTSRN